MTITKKTDNRVVKPNHSFYITSETFKASQTVRRLTDLDTENYIKAANELVLAKYGK